MCRVGIILLIDLIFFPPTSPSSLQAIAVVDVENIESMVKILIFEREAYTVQYIK